MRGSENIHILHQALTLCGYGHDTLPGHWPEGQLWISPKDESALKDPRVCKNCLHVFVENWGPAVPAKVSE
jgi:hypothetical protein